MQRCSRQEYRTGRAALLYGNHSRIFQEADYRHHLEVDYFPIPETCSYISCIPQRFTDVYVFYSLTNNTFAFFFFFFTHLALTLWNPRAPLVPVLTCVIASLSLKKPESSMFYFAKQLTSFKIFFTLNGV